MLLIMLDSLDNTVRDLCTRTLTDLAADESVRCGGGAALRRGSCPLQCYASCVHCHATQAALAGELWGRLQLKPGYESQLLEWSKRSSRCDC